MRQIIVSCCGQSETAHIPHLRLKQKHILMMFLCFFKEIKIPESKAPVFKAGKALKDLVNKK